MKCSKCGGVVPQSEKVCLKCQAAAKNKKTVSSEPEDFKSRDKRMGFVMIITAILSMIVLSYDGTYAKWFVPKMNYGALVMLIIQIGLLVCGIHFVSDEKPNKWVKTGIAVGALLTLIVVNKLILIEAAPNAEYIALLNKYSVTDEASYYSNGNRESFAKEYNGNTLVIKHYYVYSNNEVHEIEQKTYYKISGYSQEDINQFINTVKAENEEKYGSLDFVGIYYDETSDYFISTIRIRELNMVPNIKALTGTDDDTISMRKTTKQLLNEGYVQR